MGAKGLNFIMNCGYDVASNGFSGGGDFGVELREGLAVDGAARRAVDGRLWLRVYDA